MVSSNSRAIVHTNAAPEAVGPYSQAVISGGFLFSAGQIGLDPGSGKLVGEGVKEQTRQALQNLAAVLGAAGLEFRDVVKTTIFLLTMDDFATVNSIYGAVVGDQPPARSTVAVAGLPLGARVEIEITAKLR